MSTPVPVPSKAAIRALRGLVFGTTCSLALVLETRRRRIKTVQTIVDNGKRLKSHKAYRPNAAAAVIRAKEEEILMKQSRPNYYLDDDDTPPPHKPRPKEGRAGNEALETRSLSPGVEELDKTLKKDNPPHKDDSKIEPPKEAGRPSTPKRRTGGAIPRSQETRSATIMTSTHPTMRSKGSQAISKAPSYPPSPSLAKSAPVPSTTGSATDLDTALEYMIKTLQGPKSKLEPQLDATLASSALLCKALQSAGRMSDAQKLLQTVVLLKSIGISTIQEAAYLAHDPISIIEYTLSQGHSHIRLAVDLFTPEFVEDPTLRVPDMLRLAQEILDEALIARKYGFVDIILPRLQCYLKSPSARPVLHKTLVKLHNHDQWKRAIQLFLAHHSELGFKIREITKRNEGEVMYAVGDIIVSCVTKTYGFKAADVVGCLIKGLSPGFILRLAWVSDLLYSNWSSQRRLDETMGMFQGLCEHDILQVVTHPDGAYRTMIQVALEANDEAEAQRLFDDLVSKIPAAKDNPQILNFFALARAKSGNFDAVSSILDIMVKSPSLDKNNIAKSLVRIAKVFSESHTSRETEDFIRYLLQKFEIAPSKYMLTLVANQYGVVRDVRSFLGWLRFCLDSGLKLEEGLNEAILRNCFREWKFPFQDTKKVYELLQSNSAGFSSKVTETILMNSALTSTGPHKTDNLRLAAKTLENSKPQRAFWTRDAPAVRARMEHAIVRKKPLQAMSDYVQATNFGMPHCSHCLQQYATAYLMHHGSEDFEELLNFLQRVQEKSPEVDIDSAAARIFMLQLDGVDRTLGGEHLMLHAENIMYNMRARGLTISAEMLNKSARLYAEARNHQGAIWLAILAAKDVGKMPGYSVTNFDILLNAYLDAGQHPMVSKLMTTATEHGLWNNMALRGANLLKRLKQWRRRLAAMPKESARLDRALEFELQLSIEELKSARGQLRQERQQVVEGVREMVGVAALRQRVTRDQPNAETFREMLLAEPEAAKATTG